MEFIQISTVEELKEIIVSGENIYLYGAGKFSNIILEKLGEEKKYIKAVIISSKGDDKFIYNIPIYSVDEISNENDINLILGLSDENINQIVPRLSKIRIKRIIRIFDIEIWKTGKTSPLRSPILEITAKIGCSIQCKYCPQELLYSEYFKNNKSRKSELTFDEFKKCIDKTPKNTIVNFAGFVEPFLHKDAAKMICYAHESGRRVSLFTTLVGMNRKDFEQIKDIPFYSFVLHVPDKNNYAKIPITEEYIYVLDKVLDCKRDNGLPLITSANAQSEPSEEFLQIAKNRINTIKNELHDRAGNLEGEKLRRIPYIKGGIYCAWSYGLEQWVLLPDGTIVLCCMDFGLKHQIGNLLFEDYEQIKKGAEYQKICQNVKKFDSDILCRRCTSARKCMQYSPVQYI